MKTLFPHLTIQRTGFIVGYLLFGLSLLSVITVALVAMSDRQVEARITQELREELVTEAQTLRTVILNCALLYPAGNNGDAQSAVQFPKTPSSGRVADLVCPGTVDSNGSPVTVWHTLTRSGAASVSPPKRTMGLSDWMYQNTKRVDGTVDVYFYIEPDTSSPSPRTSLLHSLSYNRKLQDFMSLDKSSDPVRLRSNNLASNLP